MKTWARAPILLAVLNSALGFAEPPPATVSSSPIPPCNQRMNAMNIRLMIDGQPVTATLDDTPAARDFYALLPLTLTLNDYASTEKIADLPRKLSIQGTPDGVKPEVGDLTYYAPWGNLAIFYRDFGYAKGLVRLGHLHAGVEALMARGPLRVTLERMDQ